MFCYIPTATGCSFLPYLGLPVGLFSPLSPQLGPLSLLVMGVVAVHCMSILVKCAHHFCYR